ncbi:3'-5' exonuclease [Inmirania thermothiophila]|uniref:Inhibitor of KinA sporulation pathway (Predicted exonuclease) n=1 Tax=Inmirania thermothiophila TaxID=1750597 RepID=A0A3N1XT31_9GAMM|nr:3'-5' exonuclease [Inmirania thermothiophila]ROR29789.1 inhibitor of KinA sporulation pathway (predicted exonuclease) [Inmirania thermothiophila]
MSRLAADAVVVVDVEATCWRGPPPPGERPEIVEIGVCVLDARARALGETASILVRPERSRVSAFCTELTGLTPEAVAGGMSFAEACTRLRRAWAAKRRVWASWGDYDRLQFQRQCAEAGVAYPFGPSHLNVKALAALAWGWDAPCGLGEALERLGMRFEGRPHRGIDDARNVARVLARILWGIGV